MMLSIVVFVWEKGGEKGQRTWKLALLPPHFAGPPLVVVLRARDDLDAVSCEETQVAFALGLEVVQRCARLWGGHAAEARGLGFRGRRGGAFCFCGGAPGALGEGWGFGVAGAGGAVGRRGCFFGERGAACCCAAGFCFLGFGCVLGDAGAAGAGPRAAACCLELDDGELLCFGLHVAPLLLVGGF